MSPRHSATRSCWLSLAVGFFLPLFFPFQEISAASGGSISGKITHAVTGAGIEKARVITSGTEGIFETMTDSEGNYFMPNIPGGTYLVTARADGFLSNFQTYVQISQGTLTQVDLVLTPTAGSGVIYGRVTNEKTELGIKGARVTVSGPRGVVDVVTDEKGSYSVSELPPGVYMILVKADNFFLNSLGNLAIQDGVRTPVDIALTPIPGSEDPGAIRGRITNTQTHKGISKAQITLSGLGGFFQTETDEMGYYSFSSVPSGSYFILVKAEGFHLVSQSELTVYAKATTLLDFSLQPR